jgi:hypothetical protein
MNLFVLSFLRRIVEPKIEKVIGSWKKCCMRNTIIYTPHKEIIRVMESRQKRYGQGMWHSWDRQNMQNFAQKTCRKDITWET